MKVILQGVFHVEKTTFHAVGRRSDCLDGIIWWSESWQLQSLHRSETIDFVHIYYFKT